MKTTRRSLFVAVSVLMPASPALALHFPRPTQGATDYILMPLLGYATIILAAKAGQLLTAKRQHNRS